MICRYTHGAARINGFWNLMCGMALTWRAEDQQERGGRESYVGDPKALRARYVRYNAS